MKQSHFLSDRLEKFKHNLHFRLIKTLWPFLWSKEKGIRGRFIGTICIILTSTALSIAVPPLFKTAVSFLNFSESKNENMVLLIAIFYGLIWTLTRIFINLREVLMFHVMEKGVMQLSAHLFQHIHSLSYDFHTKRKTGEITSIIEKAQLAFPTILWPLFFIIIPTFLEVMTVSLLLYYLYGFLYGFIMLTTIVLFLGYSIKVLSWSLNALRLGNEKHYQCNSYIVDSLINFSTVKLFNSQMSESHKCKVVLQEREKLMVTSLLRGRLVSLGQDIIIGIALILFCLLTAYRVLYEGYTVGDFVLINTYVLQFSIPLGSLGFVLKTFREQLTHMEKVLELLDQPRDIKDGDKTLLLKNQKMTVSFKQIYFSYQEKRPILNGISFDLFPGKILAIVGPTGSGKSTITHLLMRFYECSAGKILVNDQDIRSLKQESYLEHIGVVPQDIILFNDTLRNNLIYGNTSVSEEILKEVIDLTLLNYLINSLPDGIETMVGERGLALSTGEKQKIGIARVLLRRPLLYIFDEATSSLDVETEEKIMQNIRHRTKNASVLIIAHRLSTVKNADEILVFDKGNIIEIGTHSSLLKNKGFYANLCTTQADLTGVF